MCIGLALVLLAGLVVGLASPTLAQYEVPEGKFYSDAVRWGIEERIFEDVNTTPFLPNAPVSRGLAAVWFWNMLKQPAAPAHNFTDITDSRQDDAVSWLVYQGVTKGTSDTEFSPNRILTRGQFAAFLHRLAEEPTPTSKHKFSDVHRGWEQDPVSWLATTGITQGTSLTMFSPDKKLIRAELITFLYRYQGSPEVPNSSSVVSPDEQLVINVPVAAAKGRCADRINGEIYDWEGCAWQGVRNPELSRRQAQALTDRVWREVVAPGKPTNPPVLEEGFCAEKALACYLSEDHVIRLQRNFTRRTFLHELSHALTSNHSSNADCLEEWTKEQQRCYHGDLYRCVADGLYVRYGGTEPAGVCGTGVDASLGDWVFREMVDALDRRSQQNLYVEASRWEYPNARSLQNTPANFLIRCFRNRWSVAVWWGGQEVFGPRQESMRVAYRIDNRPSVTINGSESTSGKEVFIEEPVPFIFELLNRSTLVIRAWNADDSEIGTATFNISHLGNRVDQLTNCDLEN